jgi:hypothetical protein
MGTRRDKHRKDFHGRYFALAAEWFDTPQFRRLSPMAKNVFLAAAMQYRGDNNGDISLPLSYLTTWSCTGNRQRTKAIAELINQGWLIRTRHGGLRMGPDLFAVSVKPIDFCLDRKSGKRKHDVSVGNGLLHLWRPERAYLRELMHPKPRTDSKRAGTIARLEKRRAVRAESTTLHASAVASPVELNVSSSEEHTARI